MKKNYLKLKVKITDILKNILIKLMWKEKTNINELNSKSHWFRKVYSFKIKAQI